MPGLGFRQVSHAWFRRSLARHYWRVRSSRYRGHLERLGAIRCAYDTAKLVSFNQHWRHCTSCLWHGVAFRCKSWTSSPSGMQSNFHSSRLLNLCVFPRYGVEWVNLRTLAKRAHEYNTMAMELHERQRNKQQTRPRASTARRRAHSMGHQNSSRSQNRMSLNENVSHVVSSSESVGKSSIPAAKAHADVLNYLVTSLKLYVSSADRCSIQIF